MLYFIYVFVCIAWGKISEKNHDFIMILCYNLKELTFITTISYNGCV